MRERPVAGLFPLLRKAAWLVHSLRHFSGCPRCVVGQFIPAHRPHFHLFGPVLVRDLEPTGALGECGPILTRLAHRVGRTVGLLPVELRLREHHVLLMG